MYHSYCSLPMGHELLLATQRRGQSALQKSVVHFARHLCVASCHAPVYIELMSYNNDEIHWQWLSNSQPSFVPHFTVLLQFEESTGIVLLSCLR